MNAGQAFELKGHGAKLLHDDSLGPDDRRLSTSARLGTFRRVAVQNV